MTKSNLTDIRPLVQQKADYFAGKRRKQKELADFISALLDLKGITSKVTMDVYIQDTDDVNEMEFRCHVLFEHATPIETVKEGFSLNYDPYRNRYLLLECGGGMYSPITEIARSERTIVLGRFLENYAAHERAILTKFTKDPEFRTCCSLVESNKVRDAAKPFLEDRSKFINDATAYVVAQQGKGRIRYVDKDGKQTTVPVVKGTIGFNQQRGEGMRIIFNINGEVDILYTSIHQWGLTEEGYKFITSTGETFLLYALK